MKSLSVWKKLNRFKTVDGNNGAMYFYSRQKTQGVNDRLIKLIEQDNGQCVALPVFQNKETGEETVVFHAKTIKQLVEFLENKGE